MTKSIRRLLTIAASSLWLGGAVVAAGAQQPPTQTKGQKAVDLCALDLAAETDSGGGRRLRVRLITVEPGGVIGVHSHQERPTIFHVLEGSLLSHWPGKPDRILGAGDCAAEGRDITQHWMENTGTVAAKYIAVDISK
jgi:quercetin dioxygenase-like cupin family protein